jgi:hypothetical protein
LLETGNLGVWHNNLKRVHSAKKNVRVFSASGLYNYTKRPSQHFDRSYAFQQPTRKHERDGGVCVSVLGLSETRRVTALRNLQHPAKFSR